MRRVLCCLLLPLLLLLTGCAAVSPLTEAAATLVPDTDTVLPEAQAPDDMSTDKTAVLYFRYLDEPYLAPEVRTLTQTPGQPYEMMLIDALLSGPGTRSASLTALFPEGTRVTSTVIQGRTLFVTLTADVMQGYADEPANWAQDAYWQGEVPLRRTLCMQSLVATVTENCDVDRVQVLVSGDDGVTDSLRLRQSYFMDGTEDGTIAQPLTRQESLLLSPATTLRVILDYWKTRDWSHLYRYVALRDEQTNQERPTEGDFILVMEQLPRLSSYGVSGGSITEEGNRATYTLQAVLLDGQGIPQEMTGHILRLQREGGLWKISLSQLIGWLEEST